MEAQKREKVDEENLFKVNCTTVYENYNFIFFFFV